MSTAARFINRTDMNRNVYTVREMPKDKGVPPDMQENNLEEKERKLREQIERISRLEEELAAREKAVSDKSLAVREKEKALKENEKAKKQLLLRLSPSLWEELAGWAAEDFRSINGQIEFLLSEAVRSRKKR